MAELDTGVEWQITPAWQFRGGYRLIGVTGLALTDNQIPQNIADMPAFGQLQHHSSLLLNGAFFGLTYSF